jgi:NRAMP (natural resistance-associated macrophage protein)-like metal ion transporter
VCAQVASEADLMSAPEQAAPEKTREKLERGLSPAAGSMEVSIKSETNPFKKLFKILGPGFVTGASDDDPSGIGTYAMAGASLGFATLWTALLTFPLMASVQFICAKVGMVTGRGIAGVIRHHYPKPILYLAVFALLAANTINAGADIGAIAAAINLLVPVPILAMIVPVTMIILVLQVWGSYDFIARVFKWLALSLVAYIGAAFLAKPNWHEVVQGTLFPKIVWNSHYFSTLVALLGTTISPYLFFWQASQEVEEEVARGRTHVWQRQGSTDGELHYAAWDVNIGMFFSNVVMYFIILATAATLFRAGKTDIGTAQDAAQALAPLAGRFAGLLLAVGLIGAGFLAVPILTSSSAYALAEAFGWKRGLNHKASRAKEFYVLITFSTLTGMLMNFIGINPVKALFWTAVINGFLAPPLLIVIMLVANNKKVMGTRTNGWVMNLLGWITAGLMSAAVVALVVTWGK